MDTLPVNAQADLTAREGAADMATPVSTKVPVELEGIINGTVIKPGESLVVSFRERLDAQKVANIASHIRALLPGVPFAIFDDEAEFAVLPKSDELLMAQIERMIDEGVKRRLGRENNGE